MLCMVCGAQCAGQTIIPPLAINDYGVTIAVYRGDMHNGITNTKIMIMVLNFFSEDIG